jgi:Secretion system C-terminal sorting domain
MKNLYTILLSSFLIVGSSFAPPIAGGETLINTKITKAYPNPATSYIVFEFDKSVDRSYSLQIFAFYGKKMTELRINESKLNINLDDNYMRGLYIYQLVDLSGKIVESGKFQVNK